MAFYDIARSKAAYDSYVVLRGTFASGAAGVWGTRYVKTTTGLVEGRMEVEPVGNSLPETAGGDPERASVSIRIHDQDNAVTKWVRGTASTTASTEYRSDGFTNFTGKLYWGVRDPANGALYEEEISPTLCLSGPPKYDGFTVTLPMASYDDRILGQSQIAFTVRDIKASANGSSDGTWSGRYVDDPLTQGQFSSTLAAFTENLDEVVPYLYGHQIVPLLKVGDTVGSDKNTPGVHTYLAWASVEEPLTTGLSSQPFALYALTWPLFVGNRGEALLEVASGQKTSDPPRVTFEFIPRSITNSQGQTFEVWLVFVKVKPVSQDQAQKIDSGKLYLDPPPVEQGLRSPGDPPIPLSFGLGPAVMRAIVRDHSVLGASGVDSTSFAATKGGSGLGILYRPTDTIRSALGKLASAGAYNLWVGVDDVLHVAAAGAFTSTDTTAIAAGLTHITAADILGDWDEELPYVSQQRGAPARRVLLKWSSDQEKFWDNDSKARHLLVEAPGVLASLPDISESIDAEIQGEAIYPPLALNLLTTAALRRGQPRRRITATCRGWLGTMEKGSLFWLSHPRGLGDNSGGGYSMRVVRLESTSFQWSEDGCTCVFEDLGPLSDLKLGVLTTITDWTATPPTAGDTISVTTGTRIVTCGVGNVRKFAAGDVGRNIWTPGAGSAGNRSSKRITHFTSTTQVEVDASDAVYAANETITAATSGYGCEWQIMETQETKTSSYKPTRIRWCREDTGLFRDGVTAGFQFTFS